MEVNQLTIKQYKTGLYCYEHCNHVSFIKLAQHVRKGGTIKVTDYKCNDITAKLMAKINKRIAEAKELFEVEFV